MTDEGPVSLLGPKTATGVPVRETGSGPSVLMALGPWATGEHLRATGVIRERQVSAGSVREGYRSMQAYTRGSWQGAGRSGRSAKVVCAQRELDVHCGSVCTGRLLL